MSDESQQEYTDATNFYLDLTDKYFQDKKPIMHLLSHTKKIKKNLLINEGTFGLNQTRKAIEFLKAIYTDSIDKIMIKLDPCADDLISKIKQISEIGIDQILLPTSDNNTIEYIINSGIDTNQLITGLSKHSEKFGGIYYTWTELTESQLKKTKKIFPKSKIYTQTENIDTVVEAKRLGIDCIMIGKQLTQDQYPKQVLSTLL